MPDAKSHLSLANHNQELLDGLIVEVSRFPDWVSTVAFYKALHVVEAALACENPCLHGVDHQHREQLLKKNNRYKHIYEHYRKLQSISMIARYMKDGKTDFSAYLSPQRVVDEVLKTHLHEVEKSVAKKLKPGNAFVTIAESLGRAAAQPDRDEPPAS